MMKANYKYYLANGAEIEYALSPDVSLVSVIDEIVRTYAMHSLGFPDHVWVTPEISAELNRECSRSNYYTVLTSLVHISHATLRLNTVVGPVDILVEPNLEFPIFFGSMKEYEDNSFNVPMEKILNE